MSLRSVLGAGLVAVIASTGGARLEVNAHPLSGQDDAALVARAREIHERVLTLDTHDDIDVTNFTPRCNYTMGLTTQVDLPKMRGCLTGDARLQRSTTTRTCMNEPCVTTLVLFPARIAGLV
jgi:hypothetical protein